MTYELLFTRGPLKNRTWTVPPTGSLKIGSGKDCEVSIPDAAVSRYHCYVEIRDGKPWVGDLASNDGLVVNGGVVRECPIDPQDVVTVGASEFKIMASVEKSKGGGGFWKFLPWLLLLAMGGYFVYQHFAPKSAPVAAPVVPPVEKPAAPAPPPGDEGAFIQALHAAYADGAISDEERVAIENARKKHNVSPARALELEPLVQALCKKDSPDAKYFDFLLELAKQGKTLEAERAALEKLRADLKLSQERVRQLEGLLKIGGAPEQRQMENQNVSITIYQLKSAPDSCEEARLWARTKDDWPSTPITSRHSFIDFHGNDMGMAEMFPEHTIFPRRHKYFFSRLVATISVPARGVWSFAAAVDDGGEIKILTDGGLEIARWECFRTGVCPSIRRLEFPSQGRYRIEIEHFCCDGGCGLYLLAHEGDSAEFDGAKFFRLGTKESGLKFVENMREDHGKINDFIELMPVSQESTPNLFGAADISEFGVPSALQEAEKDIVALMSQDMAALKAGKMSREAVAERARQKANEYAGFSTKDAARRFLLYKGAFKLLVHAGPRLNDDAVDAWRRVEHALDPHELDPRWMVSIIGSALKTIKGYEGDARLLKVMGEAKERAPFAETVARLRKRELEKLSPMEARELAEAEAALEHWSAAIKAFKRTSFGGKVEYRAEEFVSQEDLYWQRPVTKGKTGKVRFGPKERVAIGDFWWNYKTASPILARACRKHAADWYVQAILAGDAVDKPTLKGRIAEARKDLKFRRPSIPEKCEALVVDLSGGPDAVAYPIRFVSSAKNISNDKSDNLVLKIVRPDAKAAMEPSHARVARPYFLGIYEMTGDQYARVMGQNPSAFNQVPHHPLNGVSFEAIRGRTMGCGVPLSPAVDTDSFMGRLRMRTKLLFDLPDDWQWEFACRAGSDGTWGEPAGNDFEIFKKMAWYGWSETVGGRVPGNAENRTHGVGERMSNAYGFFDMNGNIQELTCSDRLGGMRVELERVSVRGGCWYGSATGCGSAPQRGNWTTPERADRYTGFRLSYSQDW